MYTTIGMTQIAMQAMLCMQVLQKCIIVCFVLWLNQSKKTALLDKNYETKVECKSGIWSQVHMSNVIGKIQSGQ